MLGTLKRFTREALAALPGAGQLPGSLRSSGRLPIADLPATAVLAAQFVALEARYGGLVDELPRNKVSPHDPRSEQQLRTGGMRGGDRMNPVLHNYAPVYATYLVPFVGRQNLVICEVGILTGIGLAIWCDVFPYATVIGLDIDLQHFNDNRPALLEKGAFSRNRPEVHTFDQYSATSDDFGTILNGRPIDVLIDDGAHRDEPIVRTFQAARPHLSPDSVYFAEDNHTVYRRLRRDISREWHAYGQVTVGTAKAAR